MKAFSVLILFTVLFSGCKKLIDIDRNYIGEWRGGSSWGYHYSLIVYDDGTARYERWDNSVEDEGWTGRLKSNGKRFQIGAYSPWFFIVENPIHIDEAVTNYFGVNSAVTDNWRMKFRYPKTIGYDGREVTMYRDI